MTSFDRKDEPGWNALRRNSYYFQDLHPRPLHHAPRRGFGAAGAPAYRTGLGRHVTTFNFRSPQIR